MDCLTDASPWAREAHMYAGNCNHPCGTSTDDLITADAVGLLLICLAAAYWMFKRLWARLGGHAAETAAEHNDLQDFLEQSFAELLEGRGAICIANDSFKLNNAPGATNANTNSNGKTHAKCCASLAGVSQQTNLTGYFNL
jgi:hypothetical protein